MTKEEIEYMAVSRDRFCSTCKYRGEMGACTRGVTLSAKAMGTGGFHCRHYIQKRFMRVGDIVRTKKLGGVGIVVKVTCRELTQDYEASIEFFDLTPDNTKYAWWSEREIDILEIPVAAFESHYIINDLPGGQPDYPIPEEVEVKDTVVDTYNREYVVPEDSMFQPSLIRCGTCINVCQGEWTSYCQIGPAIDCVVFNVELNDNGCSKWELNPRTGIDHEFEFFKKGDEE